MRIAASVIGIVGALSGIFFAQLVVSVGMMLAIVDTATNGTGLELSPEFYLGLVALGLFAVGVAGGVIVAHHPIVGAPLLLVSAIGGLVTAIMINGSPAEQTGSFVADVFPYLGPILLFVATVLAVLDLRAMFRPAVRPTATGVAPIEVVAAPSRAELASAVPMPLRAQPVMNAPSSRDIEPGTPFESMETQGEFIHVRGQDFDGFLPAWSVRRVA